MHWWGQLSLSMLRLPRSPRRANTKTAASRIRILSKSRGVQTATLEVEVHHGHCRSCIIQPSKKTIPFVDGMMFDGSTRSTFVPGEPEYEDGARLAGMAPF